MQSRTPIKDRPDLDTLVAYLKHSGSFAEVGRRFGIDRNSLCVWWTRNSHKFDHIQPLPMPDIDDTPTAPDASVIGGFDQHGVGTFTFTNARGVPPRAELDALLEHLGEDPTFYRWIPKRVDLRWADNSAAWQRDPSDRGINHSAYTGPTETSGGTVVMQCVRKTAADLAAERLTADLANMPRIRIQEGPRYRCSVCGDQFDTSVVGSAWCSTECRDSDTPAADFGVIRHIIIPDTQVDPGTPTDHLVWAGQWVREHCAGQRVRIIHLGDHWNMGSLSSYDAGTAKAEGRRIRDDLDAGNRAFQVLDEAIGTDPLWDFHFLFGNHEDRINRYVNSHPEAEGFLSFDNCVTPARWERHGYLEPVELNGISYAHYFYNPNTGKPYSGEIEGRIRQVGRSFVMGHQQGLRIGHVYAGGERRIGVAAGSFYQHDEGYKGPQGNNSHWRGIVVLNDVEEGSADPMPVSLDYLCRRYAGHRLADHEGVVV